MARFRVSDPGPDEVTFSADCGVERSMPGGAVVRGKRTLYLSTIKIYEGRFDDEMAAHLIVFIRDWATQLQHEFVRVRAGAVVMKGGAVLLPSAPEPHLAGLVGQLVRSGAGYLGDEVVNIDPVLHRVYGLSLPLAIDQDDVASFPELGRELSRRRREAPPEGARGATPRRAVSPDDLGGQHAEPALPAWIVFPSFEPGAQSKLEAFGGSPALFQFTQAILNLNSWEDRALTLMRDILETVAVSRLVVGSVPEAAHILLEAAPDILEEVTE